MSGQPYYVLVVTLESGERLAEAQGSLSVVSAVLNEPLEELLPALWFEGDPREEGACG